MNEINHIAPDHITAAGEIIPCTWQASSTGRSITARLEMDGTPFKMILTGACGDIFSAARRAMYGEIVDVEADGLMLCLGTATECKPRKAPAAPDPDKQAHGPVPEKWFIGQSFKGKGWKILFDGDAGKTRVIFPRKPAAAMLKDAAGIETEAAALEAKLARFTSTVCQYNALATAYAGMLDDLGGIVEGLPYSDWSLRR